MVLRPALVSLAAVLLTACATGGPMLVTDADQPHAVGEGTPVTVRWGDPAQFTEIRQSQNRHQAIEGDWVEQMGAYVAERVARSLPAGERADVEILDIKRAGEFEWIGTQNDDVRILRDSTRRACACSSGAPTPAARSSPKASARFPIWTTSWGRSPCPPPIRCATKNA